MWFQRDFREKALLALGARVVEGFWSAQIVGELTRTLLWRGRMNAGGRLPTGEEYLAYRRKQYDLISTIDAVCEIAAIRGITPNSYEVAWSGIDPDDLHVQLLARHVGADYVVSANTRHFPNPVGVDGKNRGELSGVIWITPDQVF